MGVVRIRAGRLRLAANSRRIGKASPDGTRALTASGPGSRGALAFGRRNPRSLQGGQRPLLDRESEIRLIEQRGYRDLVCDLLPDEGLGSLVAIPYLGSVVAAPRVFTMATSTDRRGGSQRRRASPPANVGSGGRRSPETDSSAKKCRLMTLDGSFSGSFATRLTDNPENR